MLSLFIDLTLDPHESSYFDLRSQKLTQLKGSVVTKYLVVQMVSLVKLFGLAFQQQMFDLSRSASQSCQSISVSSEYISILFYKSLLRRELGEESKSKIE